MSGLYFLFAPFFLVYFVRQMKQVVFAFRKGDNDRLKVHLLFLSLMVIVGLIVVLAIESRLGF